jgi:hypothetical protein
VRYKAIATKRKPATDNTVTAMMRTGWGSTNDGSTPQVNVGIGGKTIKECVMPIAVKGTGAQKQ